MHIGRPFRREHPSSNANGASVKVAAKPPIHTPTHLEDGIQLNLFANGKEKRKVEMEKPELKLKLMLEVGSLEVCTLVTKKRTRKMDKTLTHT